MDLMLLQAGLAVILASAFWLASPDFLETDVRNAFLATLLQSGVPPRGMGALDLLGESTPLLAFRHGCQQSHLERLTWRNATPNWRK